MNQTRNFSILVESMSLESNNNKFLQNILYDTVKRYITGGTRCLYTHPSTISISGTIANIYRILTLLNLLTRSLNWSRANGVARYTVSGTFKSHALRSHKQRF